MQEMTPYSTFCSAIRNEIDNTRDLLSVANGDGYALANQVSRAWRELSGAWEKIEVLTAAGINLDAMWRADLHECKTLDDAAVAALVEAFHEYAIDVLDESPDWDIMWSESPLDNGLLLQGSVAVVLTRPGAFPKRTWPGTPVVEVDAGELWIDAITPEVPVLEVVCR